MQSLNGSYFAAGIFLNTTKIDYLTRPAF